MNHFLVDLTVDSFETVCGLVFNTMTPEERKHFLERANLMLDKYSNGVYNIDTKKER